jgi:hypothetical protein
MYTILDIHVIVPNDTNFNSISAVSCRSMNMIIRVSTLQWNLSNPTHQGTREMYRNVQDVGILKDI